MNCPICGLPEERCPMLTGEMSMAGTPQLIKGIPNRKEIKEDRITNYY